MRTSLTEWTSLCARFTGVTQAEQWHARLTEAYAEPSRAYHTLQHLEECLTACDEARLTGQVQRPDELELALWFHDVVYDPRSRDNEEQSASLAMDFLGHHQARARVTDLILLTFDHRPRGGEDDAWMIDIDLSIFAQDLERVREYERQIRQEYAWVEWPQYREKRLEILTSFLARNRLYLTNDFHQRLDQKARIHLRALMQDLEATSKSHEPGQM